jgi:hypothetical protein
MHSSTEFLKTEEINWVVQEAHDEQIKKKSKRKTRKINQNIRKNSNISGKQVSLA